MAVTVSVDATHRLSRLEINGPFSVTGTVSGHTEIVLQQPAQPSEGSEIFQKHLQPLEGGEPITYGVMPGVSISRVFNDIVDDTIEVDGKTVTFGTVAQAFVEFLEKWRKEDINAPLPTVPQPQSR
jgi:hypothetical protein